MVLSEVARDPPSPFLTVQSSLDGIQLPTVPPPAPQQTSTDGSRSWHSPPACSSHVPAHVINGSATQRTHLQSIVSQQSLNFNVAQDGPAEQATNSLSAASAHGQHSQQQHAAAAAAAGHSDLAAQAAARETNGTTAQGNRVAGRFKHVLPNGNSWLQGTKSLPSSGLPAKQQDSGAKQQALLQPELSVQHVHSVLEHQDVQHDLQQLHLQPGISKVLRLRVQKLLRWASGRVSSSANSPTVSVGPQATCGSLVFTPTGNQQPPLTPIPWQHQVFTEPYTQATAQLTNTAPGTPTVLRSPRSSLVSSPSSCDCPLLVGRFSSTGSDGGYARSPGATASCSSSLKCSHSCSLTTSPSPGKAPAATAAPCTTPVVAYNSGCAAGHVGHDVPLLKMASSVRTPHHRHRQHRPGCRFHPQQQAQQQAVPGHAQQQPSKLQQHTSPSSPSAGGLAPQSSLRTALQQLESMASLKAARIVDKLNAGLQKMTSHRVFDGVLRNGTVGKEIMRDWELGPTLGVGASCVTRLVTERCSGRTAACKSISKQGILHSAVVKAALLAVQREVAILQAVVGHPHVVSLHAVYEDANNLHMIMDWCGGGSLWQVMERCPGYMLPESAAAAATKAVLEVLAHCHSRGVMHRDIKPDNLLIARPLDGPHQLTADLIQVSDFGISVPFAPGQVLTEAGGTMGYMAPEVLRRSYTECADVWSTGVMLYEMVCGQLPFSLGNTLEECLACADAELDLSGPVWQAVDAEARDLVSVMLEKDPARRPSAQALLVSHSKWLNKGSAKQQQMEPPQQGPAACAPGIS